MKKLVVFLLFLHISALCAWAGEETPDSRLLMLINQEHIIAEDYGPETIMDIAKVARSAKAEMPLRPEAAEAYLAMVAAMEADGVKPPFAVSGYRTYSYQSGLFRNKTDKYISQGYSREKAEIEAAKSVARPGTSEHQSGLAIDVSEDGSLSEAFAQTAAGKWLYERCWEFGFILRYPSDKSEVTGIIFEPWHFRYVGLPHSLIMRDKGWCLEEYIEALLPDQPIVYCLDETYLVYCAPKGSAVEISDNDEIVGRSANNAGGTVVTIIRR